MVVGGRQDILGAPHDTYTSPRISQNSVTATGTKMAGAAAVAPGNPAAWSALRRCLGRHSAGDCGDVAATRGPADDGRKQRRQPGGRGQ
jgi:hypothetical protein